MKKPNFSIVMETVNIQEHLYEREDGINYFKKALDEVVRQAPVLGEPEIVVVDVTETAAVRNVVKKYPHVKLLEKTNADYFECKNHGFRNTSGNIIVFCDSDCIWLPGFAQAVKETFRGKKIGMCGGLTHYPLHVMGKAHTIADFFTFPKFGKIRIAVANNLTVRREVFEKYMFAEGLLRTRVPIALFCWQAYRDGVLYGNPKLEQIHRYHHKWVDRRLQVGHDGIAVRQQDPTYPQSKIFSRVGILFPFMWYFPRIWKDWKHVIIMRHVLKIKPFEIPAVFAITAWCRLFEILGMIIAIVHPSYFKKMYKA